MNKRNRKAFTLIELLVVIAIIAILAAILFPVFAQAKRAAKGAVAISDAKQMCLAQLMYSNDFEDAFAPVSEFDSNWGVLPWSYVQQPYMKSWAILIDPTGPSVTDNAANDADGSGMKVYGFWGMPPERATAKNSTSAADFTFGNNKGASLTNGQKWYYDGIAGSANPLPNGASWFWPSYGYKIGNVPSLTTTAVASPADQVMCAQSGTWDFMWENVGLGDYGNGNDTPDNFDLYFSTAGGNTYGTEAVVCGPMARQRDSDGPTVGWFAWPSGSYANQPLPSGLTVWTGTDGHAKASPWRQLFGTTIPINGGADKAIKAFWPQGS